MPSTRRRSRFLRAQMRFFAPPCAYDPKPPNLETNDLRKSKPEPETPMGAVSPAKSCRPALLRSSSVAASVSRRCRTAVDPGFLCEPAVRGWRCARAPSTERNSPGVRPLPTNFDQFA